MSGNNIDSTNIFDEFSQDKNIKDAIAYAEAKKAKDMYFYMSRLNGLLGFGNIMGFLAIVIFMTYVYIQNNENIYNAGYLNPVCGVILGDIRNDEANCSSVSALSKVIGEKYTSLGTASYESIISMVGDVYYVSNFIFSKEVMFLLDKTQNRLEPLGILEEFDRLKNEFEPVNKAKINCSNIEISKSGDVNMKCEAFSSSWDKNIVGYQGDTGSKDRTSGTSVSIAASFINFLEKSSKNLLLIDKPKSFSYDEIVDNGGFTRKTSFNLTFRLRSSNIGL